MPSCANQEDHVSMGANAARHALEIVDNVRYVIAIELVTAAQAIDLRSEGPSRLGRGTSAAFATVRERVPFLHQDRALSRDIVALVDLIKTGHLLESTHGALGERLG